MPGELDALHSVAEAVTDRTPVDWDSEVRANRDVAGQIEQLRVIERITATLSGEFENTEGFRRWGKFEIKERLDGGGFAKVYRAHDPDLDTDVALKLLSDERFEGGTGADRFVREARRHAKVRHPNVVAVHGADRFEGRVGLWMDLVDGETLEALLTDRGTFGPQEAAQIGIELCGALAEVHAHGLVHGDIKTRNVMRAQGGRYVLMDFGSATESAGRQDAPVEHFSGTPLYMAPEVFDHARPSSSTDIYALGVLLYHLVSGRYPVEADGLPELREKHRRGESTPLRDARSDLPSSFVRVVETALATDPEHRFRSAGEVERALRASTATPVRDERPPSPRWWLYGLGLASALAAVAVVVIFVFRPFDVEFSLYRAGQDVEERLRPDSRVAPGDVLFLEIEGTRAMHVYVLNEDEAGNAFVLFPLPGVDRQNPLPAGVVHRLPGAAEGLDKYWRVTSAGGRETFLVIASRKALRDVEKEFAKLPFAGQGEALALGPQAVRSLRGVGGVAVLEDAGSGGPGVLPDLYAQLSGRADPRGLRLWQIQLNNPRE